MAQQKCLKCGEIIPEGSAFCPFCGAPAAKEEKLIERPVAENTIVEPAPQIKQIPSSPEPPQPTNQQPVQSQKKSTFLIAFLSTLCVISLGVLLFLLFGSDTKGLYRCYYDDSEGASVEMYLYNDNTSAKIAIHRSYKQAFRYTDIAKAVSINKRGGTTNYQFQVKADPTSSDPKEQSAQTFYLQLKKGRKLRVVSSDGEFIPNGAMNFTKIHPADTLGTGGTFVHRKAQVVVDPGCWMAYGPVQTVGDDGRTYRFNNGRISATPIGGKPLSQRTDAHGYTIMEGYNGWNWYYYKYDRDNRLVRCEEREDGKLVTNDFYYNARNQLTAINRDGKRLMVAYDCNGNIKTLSMSNRGKIHSSSYNITATDNWGNTTMATSLNNRRSYQVLRTYAYYEE